MSTLFLLCAVIGGTVLLFQLALTLLGALDLGVDFDDVDVDAGDLSGDASGAGHHAHSGLEWVWSMVSFRTVVALLTFFGLTGMAMRSFGASPSLQFTSASIAGLAAMYGVHSLMVAIARLGRDGTMQVNKAIGQRGTVYLTIPAAQSGTGKIHVTVQGRLEEFQAVTPWNDKLAAGAKVVVIGVIDRDTLAVEPVEVAAEPAPKLAQTNP